MIQLSALAAWLSVYCAYSELVVKQLALHFNSLEGSQQAGE